MSDTDTPKPRGLTPQAALILDYLSSGKKLTSRLAMMMLGVTNLTTRIAELRKLGHDIEREWQTDHFGRRYMEYRLAGIKEAEG